MNTVWTSFSLSYYCRYLVPYVLHPSYFLRLLLLQVSAYHLSRGHALYFNGQLSEARADYRRALELDPGNAEARRLCFRFDTKEGEAARLAGMRVCPVDVKWRSNRWAHIWHE